MILSFAIYRFQAKYMRWSPFFEAVDGGEISQLVRTVGH